MVLPDEDDATQWEAGLRKAGAKNVFKVKDPVTGNWYIFTCYSDLNAVFDFIASRTRIDVGKLPHDIPDLPEEQLEPLRNRNQLLIGLLFGFDPIVAADGATYTGATSRTFRAAIAAQLKKCKDNPERCLDIGGEGYVIDNKTLKQDRSTGGRINVNVRGTPSNPSAPVTHIPRLICRTEWKGPLPFPDDSIDCVYMEGLTAGEEGAYDYGKQLCGLLKVGAKITIITGLDKGKQAEHVRKGLEDAGCVVSFTFPERIDRVRDRVVLTILGKET